MRTPRSEPAAEPGARYRRKSLGQCFLEDRNILALEAKLAKPEGKTVLEIGAGDGRLTAALLAEKPKKLIAIEKDPGFVSILREKFSGRNALDIVEGDFLKMVLPDAGVDVVVGNIPYYISSDIIFRLKDMRFGYAVIMVQKEFAEKMVAKPGDGNYGRLSVTAQLNYFVSLERKVLRHLFRPVPQVDSAIIILRPTGIRLTALQENVIRGLFQHRNKTVRNALADSKLFAAEEIQKLGQLAKRRVRTLAKEECLEIARLLA
jgi:ribosomal RNA small subunit methyltransferase A